MMRQASLFSIVCFYNMIADNFWQYLFLIMCLLSRTVSLMLVFSLTASDIPLCVRQNILMQTKSIIVLNLYFPS